ncbi:TolC family protein [Oleiharenicola lentus]|uniref:TolC family protein n=1 Tax=Oleiharenicola lentus TaxID=2508720 RepID=A0A4Q1C686_9BACT|nr:TolC family protein [Oleiharenicola lentus]RXK54387.1 TolC family protein [Oleiharenicola lentus]
MKPIVSTPSHLIRPALGLMLLALAGVARAQSASDETAPAVSLSTLVSEITTKNPERQFYQEEIAAAKAGVRISSRLSDPELSFDIGQKRLKDSSGAKIGDGAVWSVSVTQTFEWPGRLSLRKAIANRQVELAELGVARFENALTARARTLAFGLYSANAKAAAIREVSDRFSALKETFLARDPAGVTPLLETRVIEASELALQRRATEAELAVQAALIELNQLRGVAVDAPLRVAAPALGFTSLPATSDLLAAAHEKNFDYRMRLVELEQQGFAVSLARNERYPGISVGPYLSRDNVGDRETIVGLGLSVPLPVTGRTGAAVDVANARRRQAEAAVLVALRELDREVITSALAFATKLAESRRWSPDAVHKFREAADLADRHYRTGAVPIATYVELQNSYLDAVEALFDTQSETLAAGLKVQQLTGIELNPVEIKP